ncbi:lasso peptide biosynthesis B2 protein [Halobacillus sp. SY10]|uniref:lasso peptide biosynthesis B2 protein n=1 Tax=Halobacillus sp. SY10 TaxID=3381356 RepID=UPI003878FA58
MKLMRKLMTFLTLSMESKRLLLESFFYLGWARIQKRRPFSNLAPSLGKHMQETGVDDECTDRRIVAKVSQAIQIMSKYTFWESRCLVQALAAKKMLEKREVGNTLYFGTAKEDNGEMVAHAWLRSGPYIVTGAKGMERFTVVSTFADPVGGESHEQNYRPSISERT